MNTLLGLLIIAVGSFCQSSSYVPIKKVKEWSWESFWLVQGIFAWLVFPLLGALLAVPAGSSLGEILSTDPSAAFKAAGYGVLWGVGGLTFGLSMRYLGVALGQSIALGTCAGFGTLFPAIFAGENLFAGKGLVLLLGVSITLAGIAVIGYAFLLISGFLAKTGTLGFALLVLGYMLSNFGQYCYYLIMMISILNTVEYNEYKFGTRDEAVIASLRPFITKLASALTAVLTSATYLLFDVTSYTNQISSLEQQCTQGLITESEKLDLISGVLSSTTSLQSTGLLLCMSLLPCAMMLLSYFLYKKKYILDETEYDRICVELEKRHAA